MYLNKKVKFKNFEAMLGECDADEESTYAAADRTAQAECRMWMVTAACVASITEIIASPKII